MLDDPQSPPLTESTQLSGWTRKLIDALQVVASIVVIGLLIVLGLILAVVVVSDRG